VSAPVPPNPPISDAERLRSFWTEAQLPQDRLLYLEFQSRRYRSIAEFLRPYGPWAGRRVLDLGGGVGSLSVVLAADLGGSYDLAEYALPTGAHADALRQRGVVNTFAVDLGRPDPLAELPTGYDAILLVEVLEHLLVNPLRLFRSVWDHLAPGGLFFLTTPNQARLRNRFRLLLGRSIKEAGRYPWAGSPVYGHVIEFGRAELDQLARAESLTPDRAVVVQQVPSVRPGARALWGVRLLNSGLARRWELGDDILAAYRRTPRPADGRCPVPLDPSGRV
jgi:2-polyprenyl-3-methyl-5-hydroxy-6-metoxy-1,4-benzoquinol methylase